VRRPHRAATTAIAVALALIVTPAAADAAIIVQKSIAGVRLGMTRAQVEAVLGRPSAVNRPSHEIFGTYTELRYGLTRISLFAGKDGEVFNLRTTSKKQRTSRNVGVGSSEKVLRQRVKGLTCETAFGARTCIVGRLEPGRVVTTFWISRSTRRVTAVGIGRVID